MGSRALSIILFEKPKKPRACSAIDSATTTSISESTLLLIAEVSCASVKPIASPPDMHTGEGALFQRSLLTLQNQVIMYAKSLFYITETKMHGE